MDDEVLHGFRREPSADFVRRLRRELDAQDAARQASGFARPRIFNAHGTRWTAMAACVMAVAIAFTLPPVRAGAQAFLDLFRVQEIVGVSFDAERLQALDFSLDVPAMLDPQVEVQAELQTTSFATPEEAGAAAGIDMMEPAWMPFGYERADLEVAGALAMQVVARTAGLEFLMQQLQLSDLSVPPGLDGETVTIRVPPVVRAEYRNDDRSFALWQARSPEIGFPAGVDLASLAEIGLRILGLEREEAFRLSRSVDWRTTLMVPVPAADASFRSVNIAGRDGLLVTPQRGGESMLLWAAGDRVLALGGRLSDEALFEIAYSVR